MRSLYPKLGALTAAALAGGLIMSLPIRAQSNSTPTDVAITDVVNQHVHSIALTQQEVNNLIASMGDQDTITLETSSAFDEGAPNGILHSHAVNLTRQDLIQLRDTGTVTVQTEESDGHTHQLTFINPNQCPGAMAPQPSPSVSPTPSPTPTMSPSPPPSPSPTPSLSPSPTPSSSPSPGPSSSPSSGPSSSPSPGSTT